MAKNMNGKIAFNVIRPKRNAIKMMKNDSDALRYLGFWSCLLIPRSPRIWNHPRKQKTHAVINDIDLKRILGSIKRKHVDIQ